MKIDRLIGILSILLQKEKTTAPELAEHFEVSRRTIGRDSILIGFSSWYKASLASKIATMQDYDYGDESIECGVEVYRL